MKILFIFITIYIHLFAESCNYKPSDIDFKDYSTKNFKQICYNSHFIYFDLEHKVPAIVEYKYNQENYEEIKKGNSENNRKNISFTLDKNLRNEEQHKSKDYTNTAFDRGHLAPYFLTGINKDEKKNVNKMSNIAPQRGYLNEVCWQQEELKIRERVEKNNEDLTITVGIIFNKDSNKIRKVKNLDIPDYFYMVIKNDKNKNKNVIVYKNEYINKNECGNYLIKSESELEKLLGIDFYTDRIN